MSRRLRILFLAARFPYPPHRGDRLTAWHFLRSLSDAHDVTLLTFMDGTEPAGARERVSAFCQRVQVVQLPRARSWLQAWAALPTRLPSQVAFYRSRRMQEAVDRALDSEPFDAVFVQLFRMAPYATASPHPVKVLFLGDSLGLALERAARFQPWWRRPGMGWERTRVERYEVEAASAFREAWALSPVDAETLTARGCRNVRVLPHGVDERLFGLPRTPSSEPTAMFLGNLSVPHNVDAACFAAREVWPLVRARLPQARLRLVGADAVRAVRRLAAFDGVEVTGRVEDLCDVWPSTHLLLAPLRFSTGIQNKVLEAMAAGVPVVTTPAVAEAIGAVHGEYLLAGSDAAALADAVVETLAEPAPASRRAERAREHVRGRFSWAAWVRRLEELVAEEASRPRAAAEPSATPAPARA